MKFIIIDKLDAIRHKTLGISPEGTVPNLKKKIWSWGSDPRLFLNWHLRVMWFMYLVENLWIRILVLVTDLLLIQFSSVKSLSRVWLFATPWIAACQAPLSITISRSSLKLISIESVMPSSHLSSVVPFSPWPQSLPASESFPVSQHFAWRGQSIGVSALASFLLKNTPDWSPLEWTGWISLQSKGLSRAFSNTTVQKHQFFGAQLSSQSNSYIHTWLLEKP